MSKLNEKNKPIETLCLCRVSSDKQAKKETIVSQKQLCLNYAKQNNFTIDTFFYEEAVSGWKGKRTGLEEMTDYIERNHKTKRFRVLFYDISRVARNILIYALFEAMVKKYGVEWQTVVNGKYKDKASDNFMWRLDAINAQRFSEELSEKTKACMRAMMTMGFYPLNPPLGLKRQKDEHKRVVLVADEPRAALIVQAFIKYDSGELATKHAVADFLNSFDVWNGRKISDTTANDILHNPVYTGFFAYEPWDIPAQEWNIVKIITLELFNRVQTRLNKVDKEPYKSTIDEEFPLRHEIVCEHCGHPLTAYYAKSGTKGHLHPYYKCFNKECARWGKSIRKQAVEDAFLEKLGMLNASEQFLGLCCAMIRKVTAIHEKELATIRNKANAQIAELDKQISSLSMLVANANIKGDTDMATIYETQIRDLNAKKQALRKQLVDNTGTETKNKFLTAIERGREFFKSPKKLWVEGTLSQKRRLVRLIFPTKPAYCAETGFLTASTAQIFNENTAFLGGESDLAAPLGFEPGFSP